MVSPRTGSVKAVLRPPAGPCPIHGGACRISSSQDPGFGTPFIINVWGPETHIEPEESGAERSGARVLWRGDHLRGSLLAMPVVADGEALLGHGGSQPTSKPTKKKGSKEGNKQK